jgi:hypothetical protein
MYGALACKITLFFSLWKEQADEALVSSWRAEPNSPLASSVKFEPGVSWTPGRNINIRTIYATEVARGKRFVSWIIADADAVFVECYHCPVTRLPDVTGAACCMDFFIASTAPHLQLYYYIDNLLGGQSSRWLPWRRRRMRTLLSTECSSCGTIRTPT